MGGPRAPVPDFAGRSQDGAHPFRLLLSFHYYGKGTSLQQKLDEAFDGIGYPTGVMLDSGAFSAKNVGSDVTAEGYGEWLAGGAAELAEVYVNLDVIGDAAASAVNLAILESMGLAPVPVFHGGGPWKVYEQLCEKYPYVALGNLVASADRSKMWPWLAKAFSIAERHGTRLHGFGLTSWKVMVEWPFYSVDSSSWGRGHRFAILNLWDGRKMRLVRFTKEPRDVWKYAALIRSYGVDPQVFVDPDLYHHSWAAGINAAAWLRISEQLAGTRDLRVYLAEGALVNLRYGLLGYLRSQEAAIA